jgi:hypothetical protein
MECKGGVLAGIRRRTDMHAVHPAQPMLCPFGRKNGLQKRIRVQQQRAPGVGPHVTQRLTKEFDISRLEPRRFDGQIQ